MATSTSGCRFYFVHLNSQLEPIPGTMFSRPTQHDVTGCDRKIAQVYPYQQPVTQECRPKSKLRYFYKFDRVANTIVPNSMFSGTHKPVNMCSGKYSILEFIVDRTA